MSFSIEDFTPGLDLVMNIIEQKVIHEYCCVPIDYLVHRYRFDKKTEIVRRF